MLISNTPIHRSIDHDVRKTHTYILSCINYIYKHIYIYIYTYKYIYAHIIEYIHI